VYTILGCEVISFPPKKVGIVPAEEEKKGKRGESVILCKFNNKNNKSPT